MTVTALSPDTTAISPRLLDLKAAGRYLGVSYWTVRDLVQNGTLRAVKIPCARADTVRRRGDVSTSRTLLAHGDQRLGGRTIRRTLVDRADLDRLIDRCKESA